MDNYSYNYSNKNNNRRKMMEGYSHHYNQQQGTSSRPRSQNYRRPSFGWQPPSWEKKFCAAAGVPWKKILETKKYMNEDEKVLQWNDSAAEEAFWNAKNRFWAELHGQPCNIKLPDPDMFIDTIDWDSEVDPQLILDLENREPVSPPKTQKGDDVVVFGIPVVPEQYLLTPTGWGDMEESGPQQPTNQEKPEVNNRSGWEDENIYVPRNKSNDWKWDHSYKKQSDHGQSNMSRYKVSRFNNNGNYGPSLIDNYGGKKRDDFAYERPLVKWQPVTQRW